MQQHRAERLNKLLHKAISNIVSFELIDSRVEGVVIDYVTVSSDMRDATVFFSLADEERKQLAHAGLTSAAKVIRKKLADAINLRYTPRLHFKFDIKGQKALTIEDVIEEDRNRYAT